MVSAMHFLTRIEPARGFFSGDYSGVLPRPHGRIWPRKECFPSKSGTATSPLERPDVENIPAG